jgi:RNA polymerase sigma factor (sigma-70 family)
MRPDMAAVPEPRNCVARNASGHACSAQKLGLAACPSANIGMIDSPHTPPGVQGLFHRFRPMKPTRTADPVTTLPPSTAASTFDYERTLQACAAGDRAAFQSLYQQEARHLLGVTLRIVRQRQHAEDILHDAFVNIWNKASSFDAALGSGRGWIYSLTRNLAFNAVRDGAREVSVDEETAEAMDAETSVQAQADMMDAFELRASMGRLNDCLERLEPARRNCILYAYVDGCSHGEIAERTKTPLGTVKAWIKRGMGSLRECMA